MAAYTVLYINAKRPDGTEIDASRIFINQTPLADWNAKLKYSNGPYYAKVPTGATYYIWVEADGFEGNTFTVPVAAGASDTVSELTAPLHPKAPVSKGTLNITAGQVSGVSLSLNPTSRQAATNTGAASFTDLPFATYVLSWSHPDYQDGEMQVDFSTDGQSVAILLDAAEELDQDKEAAATQEPDVEDFDQMAAAAGAVTAALDPSEAVYSNNAWEGYFTGAQARVYIGNLFLDELASIQYVVQSNAVPVYGYASTFADAFARGRSLVQGQLVLNYISENYLFTVLDEYRRTTQTDLPSADDAAAQKIADTVAFRKARNASLENLSGDSLLSGDATIDWGGAIDQRLAELLKNPDAVKAYKKKLKKTGYDPVYANPTYQDILFDIVIEIGTGQFRTFRKIEKAKLVSNEQVLDQSGNVIGEAYGFIARRLR